MRARDERGETNAVQLIYIGLGLLFTGLKLGGAIDWSWLWVLSPFWIPLVVVAICVILIRIIDRVNDRPVRHRYY